MRRREKTAKKILMSLTILASACLLAGLPAENTQAAAKEYTYTVNIYAGDQGTFTDAVKLSVDHRKSGNKSKSQVKIAKGMITVSGLVEKDRISVDLGTDSLKLDEERYYVKGVRQSGWDNKMATKIFDVQRDEDYVVAYGVRGNMVAYTVNYQDADGNELLPSDTYYGSVGDKPVVAYRYVEGYDPEVAALTKTLTANEAENEFTFVYTPVSTDVVTRQVGTPGTITSTVTELIPGTTTTTRTTTGTTGTTETAETAEEAAAPEEAAPAEEAAAPEEEAVPEEETAPLEEIGDEEVPLANQDLKDLDEEEVPTSDIQLDKVVKKGLPLAASIGIAAAAAAGLITAVVVLKKRKSKKGVVK